MYFGMEGVHYLLIHKFSIESFLASKRSILLVYRVDHLGRKVDHHGLGVDHLGLTTVNNF